MIRENFRIAFSGLISNKLRSLLSILGILIGVMSVTLLLAVGAGATKFVKGQVAGLGTNTVYVFLKGFGATNTAKTRKPAITKADLALLRDPARSPSVLRVAPELQTTVLATAGRYSESFSITGTNEEWATILNRSSSEGLLLSGDDVSQRRRVAVVGKTIQRKLFAGESPVGKTLRLGGTTFDVIGLLDKRGGGLNGDLDNLVLIPETTMQDTLTGTFDSWTDIAVQFKPAFAATGKDEIQSALMGLRGEKDKAKSELDFFDNTQLAATSNTISTALSALLGLIAGISLLVGGIGVMNIMLVTVTERTREIGIRKALGAKRRNLLSQFLIEAVVLTGVGGALGAAVGSALAQIRVGTFGAVLQPWMIGLALGVSVLIGVTFGVYPANRAAKLRPIDALRYE
jgi:putative ABC transport system permease protein